MKKFFYIFPLFLLFFLSSCSLSSSLEKQTKLLEYEKCLDHRENLRLAASAILDEAWAKSVDGEALKKRLTIAYGAITKEEDKPLGAFYTTLEYCKPLRP